MAGYLAARDIRQGNPVGAVLGARDNAVQNALVQRQAANTEQAQQAQQQNLLFQQDHLRQQDQASAAERDKLGQQEESKQLFTYLSHLDRLKANPDQFNATASRMLQDPLFQKHGITAEDLTPDQLAEALPMFAAQAGQAPADQYEQVSGPRGSVIQRKVGSGELKQIVGADNTESPNYGRAARPPSGYTYGPDGVSLMAIPGGPADPNTKSTKDDSRTFAKADKLRDEFNTQSKDFITVGDSYNMVQEVAKRPDAAGDLSMIFAFMKMLDPNSVVREQEFANAQNAAGVPDRIRNQYNKIINGERLNPTQRAEFIGQAKNLFNTRKARQEVLTKRYAEIAKRNGVNPDDVVGDLSVVMGGAPPAAAPAPSSGGIQPSVSNW